MSNTQLYKDYGHTIRDRLVEDLNGKVRFEVVLEADCIIFHIVFKGFKFRYVVTNVSESIYHGTSEEVVQSIEAKYRNSILGSFFRSDANKERLERKRLGVPAEEVMA